LSPHRITAGITLEFRRSQVEFQPGQFDEAPAVGCWQAGKKSRHRKKGKPAPMIFLFMMAFSEEGEKLCRTLPRLRLWN
jgi:hypothetical protein